MTLKKWVHDPLILGNAPFFLGSWRLQVLVTCCGHHRCPFWLFWLENHLLGKPIYFPQKDAYGGSEFFRREEFKDAIASLSPEQQKFAKAFRAMQLETWKMDPVAFPATVAGWPSGGPGGNGWQRVAGGVKTGLHSSWHISWGGAYFYILQGGGCKKQCSAIP